MSDSNQQGFEAGFEAGFASALKSRAARDIAAERDRQIAQEGWTSEHDAQWRGGELIKAAIAYAASAGGLEVALVTDAASGLTFERIWPWARAWDKRPRLGAPDADLRRALVKAGALIAAEITRLDRERAP